MSQNIVTKIVAVFMRNLPQNHFFKYSKCDLEIPPKIK